MGGYTWTAVETQRLKHLWPVAGWPELQAAFPARARHSIAKHAYKRGLGNRPPYLRPEVAGVAVDPVIASLTAMRRRKRIRREALSRTIGVHRQQVSQWERGLHQPTWANVQAWAAALGMRLTAVERVGSLASIPVRRAS